MIGTNSSPACCLIRRAASKPSITGIITSIRTSCGRSVSNSATASRPLPAVSTRCPWRLTMVDSSRRSAALSSAMRIVRLSIRAAGDSSQLILNNCSKLEMARILRTSGLQFARLICAFSPPAWSRSSRSMPRAELSR